MVISVKKQSRGEQEGNRPHHGADHSPPSNRRLRMRGATPSLPQYVFTTWYTFPILATQVREYVL